MKMKRTFGIGLVSAAALCAGIASANAADMYRGGSLKDTPPIAAPCCNISWTGFYLGGNLGAAWPSDDFRYDRFYDYRDNDDAELIGGLHLGYNWQGVNYVVLGIEGDVDFSDTFDYLASIRARLGYAFDRTLLYATAGVAFAGLSDNFFNDRVPGTNFYWDTSSDTGWVAGVGIETKVTPALSVGVEALYYSFDDTNSYYYANDLRHDCDNSMDLWTVRGRLTWHFNRDYDTLK